MIAPDLSHLEVLMDHTLLIYIKRGGLSSLLKHAVGSKLSRRERVLATIFSKMISPSNKILIRGKRPPFLQEA